MPSSILTAFATAVHAALLAIGHEPRDRFGARKVFVSAVYRQLTQGGYDVGSLESFKAALVDANSEGELELARADLVGAMPRAAVAASEIRSLGSEFHFVIDPAAREPWESSTAA